MGVRVHQEDETKLKATVVLAAGNVVEVTQDTAADLLATVTQAAKDRTVTGTVTAEQGTAASLKATVTQDAKDRTVTCDTAANLKATVTQLAKDRTVTNVTASNLKAEVSQGTAASLKVETTSSNPELDDNNIPFNETRETVIALNYNHLNGNWSRGTHNRTVSQATASLLQCEPVQPTAADLKATVTQAEKDRSRTPYTTLIDDDTTADMIYVGRAPANTSEGALSWQIKRYDESGSFLKIQFADGVSTFTKEWDERVGYSYS